MAGVELGGVAHWLRSPGLRRPGGPRVTASGTCWGHWLDPKVAAAEREVDMTPCLFPW